MLMIGKIVKSNSHTDYVCQVYRTNEVDVPPEPEDCSFGTFVSIQLANGKQIVGVIYDTRLFNPEFGNLGPRLSPEQELEIFSPDYLEEKMTLLGIKTIGLMDGENSVTQGVPGLSIPSDSVVQKMSIDDVKLLHTEGQDNLQLRYAPLLLEKNNPISCHLLLQIVDFLRIIFPEYKTRLTVLYQEWSWQARIQPVGGLS